MITKKVLIFGASGQVGRYCIRRLVKNNYKVTAVTRNAHKSGYKLKTQAPIGYLDIVHIVGHTDTVDSKGYNKKLSLKRTNVLRDYLVSKDIHKEHISVEGAGAKGQLVKTGKGIPMMKNRRAVIHFLE